MASVSRSVCEGSAGDLMEARRSELTRMKDPSKPGPVRVKLQRVSSQLSKAYPPDEMTRDWWLKLQEALGTTSSAFVNASLFHLQLAAKLPNGGICETGVNAALALVSAAEPRNEIEGALAVQMACCHAAALAVLARLGGACGNDRRVAALGSTAARLMRAYAIQMETLRRLRHAGSQHVRVEHVHISEGSQAVVGIIDSCKASCVENLKGDGYE